MNKLIVAFLLMLCFSEAKAQYFDVKKGNEAYQKGEYDQANEHYDKVISEAKDDADKKEAVFNKGNSLFRKKELDKAQEAYSTIANNEKFNEDARADAYYNLANTAYERSKAAQNPEQKQKEMKEALEHLKSAMKLNASDLETKQNYEFIKRELQELQNQQQQKQKNQNNKDQDNKDKKNQDKNKQNQQDKDNKNQDKQDKQNQDKNQQNNNEDKPKEGPPKEFSQEQAERILDAVKQDEKNMLKKYQQRQSKTKKLDKDW